MTVHPNSLAERRARHVAIIMDGNGRWASARGLPRTEGHRRGVEAVKRTVEAARDLGLEYVTLFGFSTENWGRPNSEVTELMGLLRLFLRGETAELHRNGVKLRVIGQRDRLDQDILRLIEHAEALTRDNSAHNLTVALSYGARQEIVAAVQCIAREVAAGTLQPDNIDEACVTAHLETHDLPDPDLIIRTSGEQRISNFLLWQAAYAELVFIERLWPDFDRDALEQALSEFARRDRRFGVSFG